MARPNIAGGTHAYEIAIIFDGVLDEKKAVNLLNKHLEIVTEDGGTIQKTDNWGRKKFAYPINKKEEGVYIIVNFIAKAATTDEFVRRLGLDESTLRYKVFRKAS